jgi:peptidoglycan/xylan/chitin deacetylase (PgdA/CDA1 family)
LTTDLKNLCLVIHCIRDNIAPEPVAHKELFIHLSDIDALIRSLKEDGYRFNLPGRVAKSDGPVCSLTFDDGYYNNSNFLETAEKHGVPFILFLTSYNVIHQIPFIWDIWEASRTEKLPISSVDYQKLYESLNGNEKDFLYNDSHRPFTPEELEAFAAHPLVHLAPHGHTHQPMVGKYLKRIDAEIDNNLTFLAKYENTLKEDFSLPCGLYTRYVKKRLLKRFERIYTIDGGDFSPGERVIHRISLINPDFGGPLREQIKRTFSIKSQLIRKAINIRYSNSFFYRF